MAQNMLWCSKEGNWGVVRKWSKASLKPNRANCKSCSFMANGRGLKWLAPSGFAAYDTFLALGLIPPTECCVPWQTTHISGITNTVGSPSQSRIHFHSLRQWSLRNIPAACLASMALPGESLPPLPLCTLSSCLLSQNHVDNMAELSCPLEMEPGPLEPNVSSFYFLLFLGAENSLVLFSSR